MRAASPSAAELWMQPCPPGSDLQAVSMSVSPGCSCPLCFLWALGPPAGQEAAAAHRVYALFPTQVCASSSVPSGWISSSEAVPSVWSLPHTRHLPNHGLYLCLSVFPVRPLLRQRLLGHPGVHAALGGSNGEDDKVQDFPGVSAFVPQDLQLHSLQGSSG